MISWQISVETPGKKRGDGGGVLKKKGYDLVRRYTDQLKRETVYSKREDRGRLRDDTEDASEDPYIVFLIAIVS